MHLAPLLRHRGQRELCANASCRKRKRDPPEQMPGYHSSRTDPNAPRTVNSAELISFFANFFYRDPYISDRSGQYYFSLTKENGAWRLKKR